MRSKVTQISWLPPSTHTSVDARRLHSPCAVSSEAEVRGWKDLQLYFLGQAPEPLCSFILLNCKPVNGVVLGLIWRARWALKGITWPCLANSKRCQLPSLLLLSLFSSVFSLTGFPTVNSRHFLNLVVVHKSEGSATHSSLLSPGVPDDTFNAGLSSCTQAGLEREGKSLCTDGYTAHHFLRASLSMLITQKLNGFHTRKKCFCTSIPVGTAHITLNATLGPSQKTLAAKFPEAACTP